MCKLFIYYFGESVYYFSNYSLYESAVKSMRRSLNADLKFWGESELKAKDFIVRKLDGNGLEYIIADTGEHFGVNRVMYVVCQDSRQCEMAKIKIGKEILKEKGVF